MVLIVAGHVVSLPTLHMPEQAFYLQPFLVVTALFHMQGFAFISGSLSTGPLTKGRMARVFTYLVVPYCFSKVSWFLFTRYTQPDTYAPMNLFDAYSSGGAEWYLAALVTWRLLIALLSPLRPAALLALSLFLGLVAGFWSSNKDDFALQRMFSFFPFFAAG